MARTAPDVVALARQAGLQRGDLLAVVVAPGVGVGLAAGTPAATPAGAPAGTPSGGEESGSLALTIPEPHGIPAVAELEATVRPRWVLWSNATAVTLAAAGVRLAAAWDLVAVHRLVHGGWDADAGRVWAAAHGLDADGVPEDRPLDLFNQDGGDPDEPVRPDGYLRPDWAAGAWAAPGRPDRTGRPDVLDRLDGPNRPDALDRPDRLQTWAALAAEVAGLQQQALTGRQPATVRSESAAELLCAELTVDGLPLDRDVAERIIADAVGPRARTEAELAAGRARRDAEVLRHVPGAAFDLRSPGQVKALLALLGIDVPDTRAGRLRSVADRHPVVDALLAWRKAERIATTYGYTWLDEHVGADGRLRGQWSGSDGAAGRMTATAGLHNLPAELRPAVAAEPGHLLVRADLGQIEPRVLAAVSGDPALRAATADDDLYAPVAAQLGVDRATAKVAVLGAMYGQTTGNGARILPRLEASYPVAMTYLARADAAAREGRDLRTYGGRRVRMSSGGTEAASRARGRYGRNAMVQGAAAELFKVWAATVRARAAGGATIVLCLHDELLLHVPAAQAEATAGVVTAALDEAAGRWAPGSGVRFVVDVSVVERWSDAKG
ncbi:MAG TPA: DNA polymerase [Acidimicrobiales bacterium]|nr:DNA polymerase [Acidimicrobiales bacterium]